MTHSHAHNQLVWTVHQHGTSKKTNSKEPHANRTTNSSDFTQSSRRCDLSLCGFSDLSKFTKTQVAFKLEDSRMVNKMYMQVAVLWETLATIGQVFMKLPLYIFILYASVCAGTVRRQWALSSHTLNTGRLSFQRSQSRQRHAGVALVVPARTSSPHLPSSTCFESSASLPRCNSLQLQKRTFSAAEVPLYTDIKQALWT